MRKFMINVNGKSYEVEVEEVGGTPSVSVPIAQAAAPAAPAQAPKAAPKPAAAPVAAAPAAGATKIEAPMPGTILNVAVSAGQSVKSGDILCILEAMKMENEILSPRDGVVAGVYVSKGSSVNTGDLLVTLD